MKLKKQSQLSVTFLLDESGSMESIKNDVIEGFNEYIHSLKKQKNSTFKFTLTKFDSNGITTPYVGVDIRKVEKLTDNTYHPGAMTPLYDAVVEAVEKVVDEVKDNQPVLVAILTDGFENASKEHNEQCLTDLIKRLQAKGNWTFVFLGANQDSWATAQRLGIFKGNVMDWQATPQGTSQVLSAMAMSTGNFAANVNTGTSLKSTNFFDKGGAK